MGLVLAMLRVTLAAVLLLAAGGKVAKPLQGTAMLERFALPRWLRPAVAALPAAEAAVAALLLCAGTARIAGGTCAGMLALFSALLLRNRAAGRHLPCGCFGRAGRSLADRRPLWRNAALLAAALAVACGGPARSLLAEAARLGAWRTGLLLALVAGVLALLTAPADHLRLPQRSDLRREPLTTLRGEQTTLGRLLGESGPTRILFLAPGCGACRSLLGLLDGARAGQVGPRALPLVVVTGAPAAGDEELERFLAGATEVVADDGRLARRLGVIGTPAAVELLPSGRLLRGATGARDVGALLTGEGGQPEPAAAALPPTLSRRRVVSLALGAFAASRLPLRRVPQPSAAGRAAAAGGVRCPSCGDCSVCSYDAASRKLTCRPCRQACSGKKLCASYANELPAFRSLAAWLDDRGFHQASDAYTLGMEQGGKLTIFSSLTPFSGGRPAQRALLVYDLTNGGERAWAALLDPRGRFVEVATVSAGQVVSSPVPHPPATSTTRGRSARAAEAALPAAAGPGPDAAAGLGPDAAAGYNCADVCGFALGVAVALATLPAAAVSAPEWVAAAFAASLFSSGLGLVGASGASNAVGLLTPLVLGGTLVDGVIDSLSGFDGGLGQTAFCNALCKLETKYCCNYGCGCDQDYHACLSRCPLDLAHPMAACNTYVRFGPDTAFVQVTGIPSKCKV